MNKTGFTICKHFPAPVFICRFPSICLHARLRVRRPFLYPSPCSSACPAAFPVSIAMLVCAPGGLSHRSHTLPRPERPHSFPAPAAFSPAMLPRQKHKNAKNTKKDAVPQPVSQSSDFYSDFPGNTSPEQRPFYIFFSECPQPAVAQPLSLAVAQALGRTFPYFPNFLFIQFPCLDYRRPFLCRSK